MRRIRSLSFVAAAALAVSLPSFAFGQIVLTGAQQGIDNAQADQAGARLSIMELKADARVTGRMADVTLELLIGTSGSMDEARLALTLPNDATITGYALDVGGRMIPGQLIEQPKARSVYQDEVRGRIDPGLAEVTAENVFKTRIYPLSAGAPRRIRVHFSAPFDPEKGLDLQLGGGGVIGSSTLSVSLEGYAAVPTIKLGGQDIAASREGARWVARSAGAGATLSGGITVSGGQVDAPMQVLRHASGREFFVISDNAGAAPAAPESGGRLRIYWDRSLSHRDDRIADEIAALEALIGALAPEAIDLVTFASDSPSVSSHADFASLRAALESVTYRGGSSLAGLDALRLGEARQCVLVFDGQVSVDQTAAFDPDCRLSAITGANGADGARLGRIAQRGHGKFVRIAEGQGREAATQLAEAGATVLSVRDGAGRRLDWRSLPAAGGGWLLVGEMPRSGGVNLRIAGTGTGTISRSYAGRGPVLRGDGAGVLWASQRVAELSDDPLDHEAMLALARRFQVAGPQLSFLVLERPDQYLRANIEPPEGFDKDWMDRYSEARAEHQAEAADARQERFDFVLEQWNGRRDWWNAKYDGPRRGLPDGDDVEITGESGCDECVVTAGPAAALPAPPPAPVATTPDAPPPPAPPPPVGANDIAEGAGTQARQGRPIVVTGNLITDRRQEAPTEADAASDDEIEGGYDIAVQEDGTPIMLTASRITSRDNGPETDRTRQVEVNLENLLADRAYLTALDAAAPGDRLKVLAEQELAFGSLPIFYLDTAEWFRLKGDQATAELLLLSALELETSDDETRQIVAFRLERERRFDRAVAMAERFAANASFRPQPKRALALALAARGRAVRGRAGRADLERAFRLLSEVALEVPDVDQGASFEGIETIALMEANALIPSIEAAGGRWELDRRLVGLLDTDVRVVIEWTADDADVDLWVNEPHGERVYYGNQLSAAGGQLSNDMTDGYGPEEYAIRRAPNGEYAVRINGFDADRLNPNGPGHVLVRLIRNFGRANAEETLVDVDIAFQHGANRDNQNEVQPVGVLRVGR